ncbi:cytoskeleton-associated protein 2-like [Brachyistius frenatus]|uniref:cytoskeleton-associated protein 2-like n=1 Tax=Brachyistius frenatus TaxID=100188 RepID=UPI0037E8E986
MEEGESESMLSRKELRKLKLMEYLAAKGKLTLPNSKSNLHEDRQGKKPVMSALKIVTEKENKAPADRFRHNGPKGEPSNAQSRQDPARRVFGVTNKVNVKGSILTGQQNATRPSSSRGPVQPKPNLKPVLSRTNTVVSSKSNLNAASHLKKQPNTGIQSSGKPPSNAAHTVRIKSNSKFSCSSNITSSGPMKTVSVRMSLGPVVKTKTGLIPAVTQPRNTQSSFTHTSATAARTTTTTTSLNAMKVRSSSVSSVSASQRSAVAGNKVQYQNKSNSKPLLRKHCQPSCKSQISSGLKSTSGCFKGTAAPLKPEVRVPIKTPAGPLVDRVTKSRSGAEAGKPGQLCKVAFQTSVKPESRSISGLVSRATRAVVTELGRKTKTSKETGGKKERSSANSPPPQAGIKRTGAPVMSQTAPQPARTVRLTGRASVTKTPKVLDRVVPQTEGKKLTAAQEERLTKLQEWREAKGISYKRPPMPAKAQVRRTVCVSQPFWTSLKEEDEAHSLISAVDRSLADCIKLLQEDFPADQVKQILSRLPALSQKFAKYWICRARLMEQEGNLDVLPMFEEAVRVVLEPVDELRTVVFEILKKKDAIQASEEKEKEEGDSPTAASTPQCCNNPTMTPKSVRLLICGEKGASSAIKYKITATPGGPSGQQTEPVRVNGREVRFFTPVRRSVRIERASLRYPAYLQDRDLCVASFNDRVAAEDEEKSEERQSEETSPTVHDTPMYFYRENEALEDKVFVQLVREDGV